MLDKYTDKSILIIGGGTSTLDVKWENLDYDYIWTCNDFFKESRVLNHDIDFYLLSYTTDLSDQRLRDKLRNSSTTVIIEGIHYRGKEKTVEFKEFQKDINIPIYSLELPTPTKKQSAGAYAGAAFRLILVAMHVQPESIYFSGFDGFNKDFTNVHAFTKHPGLKDSDTRRTFEGTYESYKNVFTEAYKWFLSYPNYNILNNLGEGFDYNIGTEVSKKYFPLKKEIYEVIR